MALLGLVGVAFLGALSTASRTLITTDERETAKNIAEMQMEYIKSFGWSNEYEQMAEIETHYPDYEAIIETSFPRSPDTNLQKITITIQHHGKNILSIEGYKEKQKL
jgi:hypothetical protein